MKIRFSKTLFRECDKSHRAIICHTLHFFANHWCVDNPLHQNTQERQNGMKVWFTLIVPSDAHSCKRFGGVNDPQFAYDWIQQQLTSSAFKFFLTRCLFSSATYTDNYLFVLAFTWKMCANTLRANVIFVYPFRLTSHSKSLLTPLRQRSISFTQYGCAV